MPSVEVSPWTVDLPGLLPCAVPHNSDSVVGRSSHLTCPTDNVVAHTSTLNNIRDHSLLAGLARKWF